MKIALNTFLTIIDIIEGNGNVIIIGHTTGTCDVVKNRARAKLMVPCSPK